MSMRHANIDRPSQESSRKRSRSPYREDRAEKVNKRHRSGSAHGRTRHHNHTERKPPATTLPLGARPLQRDDFGDFTALFAEYLDVQKGLDYDRLSEHEVKGRWKSFLGKWNRGELAEGWYDAETKLKVDGRYNARERSKIDEVKELETTGLASKTVKGVDGDKDGDDDDDDDYGPSLPNNTRRIAGPVVPKLQDLQLRQDLQDEDREAYIRDLRYDRKQDRLAQKERLEELVPRADPGSRERQLEKKREATAANHSFREAKSPGAEDVAEGDLMGDQGLEGFKADKKKMEKVKNQREIRKEEMLRARAAEREERMEGQRRKEEKTMQMLSEIARQRFG